MHFAASADIQAASRTFNHAFAGADALKTGAKLELGMSIIFAALAELGSANRALAIGTVVARLTRGFARRLHDKVHGLHFTAGSIPAIPFIPFAPGSQAVH